MLNGAESRLRTSGGIRRCRMIRSGTSPSRAMAILDAPGEWICCDYFNR